jgi:quercetin dioxygenase-like cupin family protein
VPPGAGPMAYIQQRASEGTYVLDGGPLELRAGDRTQRLGPGSFVRTAAGTAHELKNAGEGEARLLRWCFPAGFDRFLFAAGREIDDPDDPPETTEADRKRVRDLAPEFGIEMEPDEEAFSRPSDIAVARSGEGPTTPIAGNLWTTFVETDGFTMYDVAVAPGEGAPPMQHEDVDLGCYVVGGTMRLDVDDRPVEAKAGTFVHLPAGTRLRLLAAGEQPARVLLWATPAADLLALAGAP